MKKNLAAFVMATAALCVLQCANDYNPFENYSNAQAYVSFAESSKKIREGDTLAIFSTETLAVFTAVREKIDSFRVDAAGNRYWPDTVIRHPSDKETQLFLLSYWDTGRVQINLTTFRSNNATVSLPAPLSYYVRSPLKQSDISTVLNAACTLSTAPVTDGDVLYIWRLGKDTLPGVASNTFTDFSKYLLHIQVGKTDTGSLWVTDFRQAFRSPSTMFTYLFYQPSPPRIKCTTKGLHGDTVITSDSTLLFSFQVIDSSGQGLASVDLSGEALQSLDSTDFYATLTGINQYTQLVPKVEVVKATNKIGQTSVDTFYVYYEATGAHGDLVKFRLINPPDPALTTRVDTLLYIMYVDNYSHPVTVSVTSMVIGPTGANTNLVPDYSYSDSTHRCVWLVPLAKGIDSVRTVASIPDLHYSAETTLVVERNLLYVDTTPPVILGITANGVKVPLEQKIPTLQVDSPTVIVEVTAVDNESGIASVTITDVSLGTTGTPTPITMTYQNYEWVSSSIAFGARQSMTLHITVKNKTVGAYTTTTRDIVLTRRAIVVSPPVTP
ncbi:MAG TPA: hypothetical protein VLX68_11155 [Chitinivibrionales bacterium]|nr:hypothetical protein [Chitinivibrionales bacterium]